ncbi:MAG: PEP-CTERM sorting domain-containing protein [Phenylobacterium sp.]|nr:MAG: PEP-CTERM sorting domain-containing protein [Phenylobacterium sp.]
MSFNEGGVYSYDSSPQWTFSANGVGGTLSAILSIPVGMTTMGIGADLQLDCRAGTDCLFGHTASLGFGPLASGLSYTSASGTFLTGLVGPPTGGVPEPGTWALMITGFGSVGAMIRRRRLAAA